MADNKRPDRLHTFSREDLEGKYRLRVRHNEELRDELRQMAAQNESLHAALMEAVTKVEAYEAGRDDSEPVEGAERTAAQVWHMLLGLPEAQRLNWIDVLLRTRGDARSCFAQDHQGRIDALTYDLTDVQVRLESALGIEGPRPVTALVTAVEVLRQVMVDGIAAREPHVEYVATEPELPDFRHPDLAEEKAKVVDSLKAAGIDLASVCGFEWPGGRQGDVCGTHLCGTVNPLHAQGHECGHCGATLSHVEAEKIEEAKAE